jgi:hypothetical protein
VDIAPGRVVQTTFTGFLDCAPGTPQRYNRYGHFQVSLPSGETVEVHRQFATGCGVHVEALGVPAAIRTK